VNIEWTIMPLDKKSHKRADFNCGEPELNEYLQKFASQNAAQNVSQTFVMVSATNPQTIRGGL